MQERIFRRFFDDAPVGGDRAFQLDPMGIRLHSLLRRFEIVYVFRESTTTHLLAECFGLPLFTPSTLWAVLIFL